MFSMDFTKYFVAKFIIAGIIGAAIGGLFIWISPIALDWINQILSQVTA